MDFTYKWHLSDLEKVKKNNLNVFSCFACGGGSTMGYKMAGYNVIGCNEIDPEMIKIYKLNHNPKYAYLEGIQTFKNRTDLPKELYNLDILDGSPPCSSFSMSGSREKAWGKKKKFREGQKDQILDDLFFHYIELAHKLRPKVVIAENVKGLIMGNAKGYIKEINELFKTAGYEVQLFLLNGSTMGLPQKRERVFFVCRRRDLKLPQLILKFNEKPITLEKAFKGIKEKGKDRSNSINYKYWKKCLPGKSFATVHPKGSLFNWIKLDPNRSSATLASTSLNNCIFRWDEMRLLSKEEVSVCSSFPLDYKFKNDSLALYQMGMSVPPLMMYKISKEINKQLFTNRSN